MPELRQALCARQLGVSSSTAACQFYGKDLARGSRDFGQHCCPPELRHEPILKHSF
ncbi:MAG: hypothetical protein Q4F77_04710 [Acinetobacter sp.]|uniref:hypothetical protein n=1 Tax=Acinetobacter sp. TaxID=472 RepID=UPI0026E0678B|nr:hypothetical protein [Acinetobacter sp.]MDO5542595.1 hypothetical protein [Acinetobacter sp.]